jgi:hypothetical protein
MAFKKKLGTSIHLKDFPTKDNDIRNKEHYYWHTP